jgi:hypothetical protein
MRLKQLSAMPVTLCRSGVFMGAKKRSHAMTPNLLPCPFCGGDANAAPESQHYPGCYFDVIARLKAANGGDISLAPEVLRSWNRRAQLPSKGGEAVELVELLTFLRETLEGHRWAWEGDAISRIDAKLASLKP